MAGSDGRLSYPGGGCQLRDRYETVIRPRHLPGQHSTDDKATNNTPAALSRRVGSPLAAGAGPGRGQPVSASQARSRVMNAA
jgi:hypothetical protein